MSHLASLVPQLTSSEAVNLSPASPPAPSRWRALTSPLDLPVDPENEASDRRLLSRHLQCLPDEGLQV